MTEKKRLSLCMITKDDEKHLANCLDNLKELVDEIIVVDIGSRDQTIALAKEAGAKVYQIKWYNNYSEAKNLCLEQATGRWALFLQANEMISKEQLALISPLLDNPNVEGYLLYLDMPRKNYRVSSPVQSLRLVRNRGEYRYQYKAYARIPDELLTNIKDAGIRIVQQADSGLAREAAANALLLEAELKEHPEDSFLQYMYGIELLNQKKYKESAAYLQKARIKVNLDYLYAPHLYKCLSWALISLKRHKEAFAVLEEGIKYFSFYTDLLVLRGELHKQFGHYREAIQDLERSIKIREQPSLMMPRPEISIPIILEILGEIHEEVFNYRQALHHYRQAYLLNKSSQKLLAKIEELIKKLGTAEVLGNFLQAAKEQNDFQQLMLLMDILFQERQYAQVLAQLEYLESSLGKSEQTECIKYCCYLMLGEEAKAELYYSAVAKESPFYHHILLQRIESCWYANRWQQAEQLLKKMDDTTGVDNQLKDLYHLLHQLLTGKSSRYPALAQQEYEIAFRVQENFLRMEEVEKARILLPLLLQGEKAEQNIKLAEIWAKKNHCQTIAMIFREISDKQKQLEFKQKIIWQLLHHDHIETAQQLMELGGSQPLGLLENLLWSKGFIKKAKKWIDRVHPSIIKDGGAEAKALPASTKPSKALLNFHHSLGLTKSNINERTIDTIGDNVPQMMTWAKIHGEIGDFYANAKKKKEALSAYLGALQWEPLDHHVQAKIMKLSLENPTEVRDFLGGKIWVLEGSLFSCHQVFNNYIQGVLHFKNQQFEQALAYFTNIGEDETSYPIAFAHIISIFWLTGKETEAERRLAEERGTATVLPLFFRICQSYALDQLAIGQRQYPFSELIKAEMEQIRS